MGFIKKMLASVLALTIASAAIPLVTASAATSGECGQNVSWSLSADGTLTISGTGTMYDLSVLSPILDEPDAVKKVIVEEGVTSIGNYAFQELANLTSVEIPDTVTSIGNNAFMNCCSLSDVEIPASVETIGYSAFRGTAITEMTIPEGVTSIGNYAFVRCPELTAVSIPSTLNNLGYNVFNSCVSLTAINVDSKNETYVSVDGVLLDAAKTKVLCYPWGKEDTSYTLPDTATYISGLLGAPKLRNIYTNNNEKYYSLDGVLCGTSPYSSIYIYPAGRTSSTYTIPSTIKSIETSAFLNAKNLKTVNIPTNVKYLWDGAFAESGLTSVDLHDGLLLYGTGHFSNCTDLVSAKLPNYGAELPSSIFAHCGLKSITIPERIKTIGNNAFYDCKNLASVTLNENLTEICYNAFMDCPSLTSISFGSSLTKIGAYAFEGTGLTTVKIPPSVTEIENTAFYCDSLKTVYLPTGIDTSKFSQYAFHPNAAIEYYDPEAVENARIIHAAGGDGKVDLEWGTVSGATNYKVYSYLYGDYALVGETSGNTLTVEKLTNGTTYGFLVRAYVDGVWSNFSESDVVYATPTNGKPTITGYKVGDYKVKLEWQAVPGAEMYRVYTYRKGVYTRAFTCDGDRTVATVSSLNGGLKYGFVVSAKVNGAWTDYSNTADLVYAVPTGVTKPTITGCKAGDYKVKLEWSPIANASMYRVYTYENGVYKRQFTCDGSRTIATVTNLNGSKEYAFVVSVKVGDAWSDYSDVNDLFYATTTGTPKPVITGYKCGDGKVKLEWTALDGAEMYRVYTYDSGIYTRQFTCDGNRNVATVSNLTNGKQYAFTVSAKVSGVWTDYTDEAFFLYATPNA